MLINKYNEHILKDFKSYQELMKCQLYFRVQYLEEQHKNLQRNIGSNLIIHQDLHLIHHYL